MPLIIAVVGASASGKSSLVSKLTRVAPPPAISVLRVDDYYHDLSHLEMTARERVNFDHPTAIEFDRLRADLEQLKRGASIACPSYDFSRHTRSSVTTTVDANKTIIMEGVLALADPLTAALVDRIVFVETPLSLCLERRVKRDAALRSRSEASVRDFWASRAAPMFLEFVEPWHSRADFIVQGDADLDSVSDELTRWIAQLV